MPFPQIVAHVMPHFITRQIFTGAGKVGTEAPVSRSTTCPTSSPSGPTSSREEVGLETTLKRPIVNTRDELHADAQKYRRLHVIVGDANPSEVATFLKIGTTAIVLSMIEDDCLGPATSPWPRRCRRCGTSPTTLTLSRPLGFADGSTMTALEMQ